MTKTTILAEVGVNHNGSLEIATALIDVAKEAGVDYIKFQKREPRVSVPRSQWNIPKVTPWGVTMPYIEYKERMEFHEEEYDQIDAYCKLRGIKWLASAWDTESVDFLLKYKPDYLKGPSAMATNLPLLKYMRGTGIPIVLSTGMCTWEDVDIAVEIAQPAVLLHCVSTYPCANEELNLRCVTEYQRRYPSIPIGYSGHEVGLMPTVAAVALGAVLVERHITLNRTMKGTDQAASVEPEGLRRLVHYIRQVEQAMGDGQKRIWESETPNITKLRTG